MSESRRSNAPPSAWQISSASPPSSAAVTAWPLISSARVTKARTLVSSSATRIRAIVLLLFGPPPVGRGRMGRIVSLLGSGPTLALDKGQPNTLDPQGGGGQLGFESDRSIRGHLALRRRHGPGIDHGTIG